jgi:dTDP-4-amino-4,6-dideoxygalactose transaminase
VYHQFTIRSTQRDELRSVLDQRGIGTGVYYPIPLHLQPALAGIVDDAARPVAERASENVLSLPIYAELSDDGVDRVCEEIDSFFRL